MDDPRLLDSPEIQNIRRMMREIALEQAAEDQAWWDSLSTEERARAFRKVAGLIYQSEVKERGSYRHAMYDVFEIDYSDGLLCHYMELHNLIHQGLQAQDCK